MAKKRRAGAPAGSASNGIREGGAAGRGGSSAPVDQEVGGATLKERLGADVLGKLKAQADEWKQAEADRQARKRQEEEAAKKREQELRESDFAYLLDNSDPNWNKYK